MKDDADPFLCECRAYQQIQKCCTPEERSHFLAFYGTTEIQMTEVIPSVKPDVDKRSGIVLDIFGQCDTMRCLKPAVLNEHVFRNLDIRLADLQVDPIALRWYRDIYCHRKETVDILHAVGIIHGDLKNDSFQVPESIHDGECYDFSLSYTFSNKAPTVMNGLTELIRYEDAQRMDHDALFDSILELCVWTNPSCWMNAN